MSVLAAICVLFLAARVPLMYRQPGGMDEGDFAVPGCTILSEGIPRIPYVPSRNREGYFYRADEALFVLPPLYFYWQAACYAVLSPGYGTARLASGVAGILAVVLAYFVGRRLTGSSAAALLGAGLYSVSRVFFFPAMSARPDMLCCMFGLAAIVALLRWRDTGRLRWLIATAAALGLGGLTHPFAAVYAIQVGAWVLFCPGTPGRRLLNVAILVSGSILVFSLWLILIIPRYEVFHVQFFNNVLSRSGPGLLQRFLWPWEAIRWQTRLILERGGPMQVGLMACGLAAATIIALRSKSADAIRLTALAWSGVYLLVVLEGVHPSSGYWCYPGAWLMLCVGWCAVLIGRKGRQLCRQMRLSRTVSGVAAAFGVVCLLAWMLPGSGVRAWIAHARHWSDPAYDAAEFVQELLRCVPRDARVVADGAYVLPFYLDDRSVILAGSFDLEMPDDYLPYDYHVAGRNSLEEGIPRELKGRFLRSFGVRDDIFACYAELYESSDVGGR